MGRIELTTQPTLPALRPPHARVPRSQASAACAACPSGTYSSAAGVTACLPCPRGSFCADGWVLNDDNEVEAVAPLGAIPLPLLCPRGTYSPYLGAASPFELNCLR